MAERTTPRSVCWLHARNHVWANGWYPALDNGARFLLALCLHADRQRLPDGSDIRITLTDLRRLAGGTPTTLRRWRATCVAAGVLRYRSGSGRIQLPSYTLDMDRLSRRPSARRRVMADDSSTALGPALAVDPSVETGDAITPAEIDTVQNEPVNSGGGERLKMHLSPYSAPPQTEEEEEETPASLRPSRGPEPDPDSIPAKVDDPLSPMRIVEAAHLALTGGAARDVDSRFQNSLVGEIEELPAERRAAFAADLRAYCEAERANSDRVFWSLEARGIQIYHLLDKHGSPDGAAGGRDSTRRRELKSTLKALQARCPHSPDMREVVAAVRDASLVDWLRADDAAFNTLARWCGNWWTDREADVRRLLRQRLDEAVSATPPKPAPGKTPNTRPNPTPDIAPTPAETAKADDEPLLTGEEIARMREEGRRTVAEQHAAAATRARGEAIPKINIGKPGHQVLRHPGAHPVIRPGAHPLERPPATRRTAQPASGRSQIRQ
ncbi:MAG: hypothetical protein ABGY41_22855 [Candidatus Poribacteria bacterium]